MSIYIKGTDLQSSSTDMKVDSFSSKMVYGLDVSVMESVRPAGYHSRPHYHTAEQINICMEGELYFYTDTQAYKLRPGDIVRVPPNVLHWAYNKGGVPCRQITVHSPSFQNCCATAVGLFAPDEQAPEKSAVENLYLEFDKESMDKVEAMTAIGES